MVLNAGYIVAMHEPQVEETSILQPARTTKEFPCLRCSHCASGATLRCQTTGLAFICSYERTYCPTCAGELGTVCSNCGGELVVRARRQLAAIEVD